MLSMTYAYLFPRREVLLGHGYGTGRAKDGACFGSGADDQRRRWSVHRSPCQADRRSAAAEQAGDARRPHRGTSKIQYITDTAPDAPFTPAEREAILRLVGKIIGDVHLAEIRKAAASSKHVCRIDTEPAHDTSGEG